MLVSGLEAKFEGGWKQLAAVNWGACEGVGEESPYVRVRYFLTFDDDLVVYELELDWCGCWRCGSEHPFYLSCTTDAPDRTTPYNPPQ